MFEPKRMKTQPFELTRTFVSPIPDVYPDGTDFFGFALDIHNNKVLIGASGDDTEAINTGIVHLFDVNTGELLQTFSNPSPDEDDSFGLQVAINNNYVLVGATGDDTGAADTGIVHLFDVNTGELLQTFSNPNLGDGDNFGGSVALEGNKVLIGSPSSDIEETDSGIAYLFDAETGEQLQTFFNPNPSIEAFGASLSFAESNKIVIGSPQSENSSESGAAYIFDANTGELTQSIDPTPDDADSFGFPIEADRNKILIGSTRADTTEETDSGIVYLYDTFSGKLLQSFENPNPSSTEAIDAFGASIAINGNNTIVGAPLNDITGLDSGTVYLFDSFTGELLQTFANPTPNAGDNFGIPVDIDGNDIVIGSPFDVAEHDSIGTVSLYQKSSAFHGMNELSKEQDDCLFGAHTANNLFNSSTDDSNL